MRTKRTTSQSRPYRLLDRFLALDKTVVELSMRAYCIPRKHQVMMQAQNRRLHEAVRQIDLNPQAPVLTGFVNLRVRPRRAASRAVDAYSNRVVGNG